MLGARGSQGCHPKGPPLRLEVTGERGFVQWCGTSDGEAKEEESIIFTEVNNQTHLPGS